MKRIITTTVSVFLVSLQFVISQGERYQGGPADGYQSATLLNMTNENSKGGLGDGHAFYMLNDMSNNISKGGKGDGHTYSSLYNLNHSVSLGGIGDGFAKDDWIKLYWTGVLNSDWNKSTNWSNAQIPLKTDEVVIPSGTPHYPILEGEFLNINQNGDPSDHSCKSLFIAKNAFLLASPETQLINFGLLEINGLFSWRNTSTNAIQNKPNAQIVIGTTGRLEIIDE